MKPKANGPASPCCSLTPSQSITRSKLTAWLQRWRERGRTDVHLTVDDFLRHANHIAPDPLPDQAIDQILKETKTL
jgi:hypothetical protein